MFYSGTKVTLRCLGGGTLRPKSEMHARTLMSGGHDSPAPDNDITRQSPDQSSLPVKPF